MRSHGINTFEQLAALDANRLESIVQPSQTSDSPPAAVLYAAWTKLAHLSTTCEWDAFEAEESRLQAAYSTYQDDLQQIRGIGPELDRRLRAQGILSFTQLAQLDGTQLDEILQSSGVSTGSLGQQIHPLWRQQVALAADEDWDALEALQVQLVWWDKLESLTP